jgi:hypothetical protein
MAQYLWPKASLKFAGLAALAFIVLCGLSPRASAQWNLDAMLGTKTDWFAHQCYISDNPALKVVTFMAVGDFKLFSFIIQENDFLNASADLDHKDGEWKVSGEQGKGRGDDVKKEMRTLSFKLVTSKQFGQMMKTQPKEACKD